MAISSSAVFQVGATGGGSDTNGGFFVAGTGTDYSQQSSPQATGTVTSASTTVTATTGIFTAAMVGNAITDGTTWKQITAYTSSTVVTVDSAPSWTAASIVVGGALASPAMAAGIAQVSGQKIWVSYNTAAVTVTTATPNVHLGTVSLAGGVTMEGYGTTRGDRAAMPSLSASGISSCTMVTMAGLSKLFNIGINGNSLTGILAINCTASNASVDQSTIQFCTNGAVLGSNNNAFGGILSRVYVDQCTQNSTSSAVVAYVSSVNNSTFFFNTLSSGTVVLCQSISRCLFFSNTGTGSNITVNLTQPNSVASELTLYNNVGVGINCYGSSAAGVQGTCIVNCLVVSQGTYAFQFAGLVLNCASYNSGTARNNNCPEDINPIILTGNPFVSSGSNNFALNNTAGAGAACRQAAYGGVQGNSSASYLDVGAFQSQGNKITWVPFTIDGFSG